MKQFFSVRRLPKLTPGVAIALPFLIGTPGAIAQASNAAPNPVIYSSGVTIFENVTLTPNFAPDPAEVRGLSGGRVPASDIAGITQSSTGLCNGFVDREPDHIMVLNQPFAHLSLQVQSLEDTTLVVRDELGNRWCNDNYLTHEPAIIGAWAAGTYQIWVGGIAPRQYAPYVLNISETQAEAIAVPSAVPSEDSP